MIVACAATRSGCKGARGGGNEVDGAELHFTYAEESSR